jgi:cytochrome c553
MGDGNSYKHQTEALKIQCQDCHTQSDYKTTSIAHLSTIESLDYGLREYQYQTDRFIITEKDSIPLVNTYFDKEDKAYLISKINQSKHPLNPSCKQDQVHQSLDCNMCHTAWAPSCIGCHTSYDNEQLLKNGNHGRWTEMLGGFTYAPPVMGVQYSGDKAKIIPAVPGMITTLDKSNFKGEKKGKEQSFLRLFAPVAAHTTTKEVRSCESCHTNPQALGYGQGTLNYSIDGNQGKWNFESTYEKSAFDNLPQDAWVGFLSEIEPTIKYSAHKDFYPLNQKQQKRILQVGACINCHKNEKFKERLISGEYQILLKKKSEKCILPK